MKTKLLFLMPIGSIFTGKLNAQQIYSTLHGDLAISLTNHDSTQLIVSNDLLLLLDYETSKVTLRVAYETFHTQIDTLDAKLNAMKGTYLEYTGKLGITINTRNYNPQKYNMEGTLTSANPPVTLRGNGSMTCLPSGDQITPACLLLITLETSLSALRLNQIFPDAEDGVRIEVRQSILKKEGE